MADSSASGLQFLFEKSKGVDNIHIYNQSKDPLKISRVEVETNVFVGDGHDGERNLTNETRDRFYLAAGVEPSNEQKIAFFGEQVQVHGLNKALNMFFTPWGSLYYGPQELTVSRKENAERYVFTLSYAKPVTIGPYERLTLSYSNSFHGLPIRSPIRGVQYLPRVSVKLDQGPQYRDTRQQVDALARPGTSPTGAKVLELAAMILNAETGQRVLDTRMANKARSADLTRRLVGYYANYFMYKRNYFVTDIPVDLVNCISYGMMGLELDGSLSSSDEWADNWQVAALQYMKQLNPALRVSLIVGGWPKSPMLHFRTVAGPADFPATAQNADDFWIYHVSGKQQWRIFYGTGTPLSIDGAPAPYGSSSSDPGGVFDPDAPRRALFALLSGPGASYDNCDVSADGETLLAILEQLATAFHASEAVAPFSALLRLISRDPVRRQRFAQSAASAIRTLGFDGLEIDWEYPDAGDGDGYVQLLQATRQAIGEAELAIAAPAAPSRVDALGTEQWRAIGQLVDHVNVMSYDYYGSWSDYSWFNAPMKIPADKQAARNLDPTFCVTATLDKFLQLVAQNCLTRRQLALGLAAYGRVVAVDGADDHNRGLICAINKKPVLAAGETSLDEPPLYRDIVAAKAAGGYLPAKEDHSPSAGWPGLVFVDALEGEARAPYAYRSSSQGRTGLSLTYDDPRSLREKVRYALAEQLGGVMVWDLSGDVAADQPASLLAAVADELRQSHPASQFHFTRQTPTGPWIDAAKLGEALPPWPLKSQVQDYGAAPRRHLQVLGGPAIAVMAALPVGALALSGPGAPISMLQPLGPGDFSTARSVGYQGDVAALLPLRDGRVLVRYADGRLQSLCFEDEVCRVDQELGRQVSAMVEAGPGCVFAVQGQTLLQWRSVDDGPFVSQAPVALPAAGVTLGVLAGGQPLVVTGQGAVLVLDGQGEHASLKTLAGSVRVPTGLLLLNDGRLLAFGAGSQLALWDVQRDAQQQLAGLQVRALRIDEARPWITAAALPNGAFATLAADRLLLWSPSGASGMEQGFEVQQQIVLDQASGMTVTSDGALVLAQGSNLLRLDFPCWPRVTLQQSTPWSGMDADGRTCVHWMARTGHADNLRSALAAGTPPGLQTAPGRPTLLAEALNAALPDHVGALLAAGAPVWQPSYAGQHGDPLDELLMARLLPASLRKAIPGSMVTPVLKPDVRTAQLPDPMRAFLRANPTLTVRMANSLMMLEPALASLLQDLLSVFTFDSDAMATLQASEPGRAVLPALQTLAGKTFADQAALQSAVQAALGDIPLDDAGRNTLVSAVRRVDPGLQGQANYDLSVYQLGCDTLVQFLDLTLQQALPALQKQLLLDRFAELALPQEGNLLAVKPGLGLADLPQITRDFLTLYPAAGRVMAQLLARWSFELERLVSDFVQQLPDSHNDASEARVSADAWGRAHQAVRSLLVATVRPGLSHQQAADFLNRNSVQPWAAAVDPFGQPQGWANWAFDPPIGTVPAAAQQDGGTTGGASSSAASSARGSGGSLQPSTPPDPAQEARDTIDYIKRANQSIDQMREKNRRATEKFDYKRERNREAVERLNPLTGQITETQSKLDQVKKAVQDTQHRLDTDLHYDPNNSVSVRLAFDKVYDGSSMGTGDDLTEPQKLAYLNRKRAEAQGTVEAGNATIDTQRKALKGLIDKRTTEVDDDPSVRIWNERRAALRQWNDRIDTMRSVVVGMQGLSSFTRKIVGHFMSDGDSKDAFNQAMDWVDKGLATVAAVVEVAQAVNTAMQMMKTSTMGGVFGLIGAAASLFGLVSNIFFPQPDPYLEAAKAISKQITQVYEVMNKRFDQIMDQMQSLNWQMSALSVQMDERFDAVQRQIDDVAAQMTRSLEQLSSAIASGFRTTRVELRAATQQTLASIVWSHDDLAQRIDLANLGLRANLASLQAMMSVEMLNDLRLVDIVISNAENEQINPRSGLIPLQKDPARLQDLRDRLDNGIRYKLLAGGEDRPLADLCFSGFGPGSVMAAVTDAATNRFSECYAYYYSKKKADSYDRSSKVWGSTALALPLARRYLLLQSWYGTSLDSPLSLLRSVQELVEAPAAKSRQFLCDLRDSAFFGVLIDQQLDAALALQQASLNVVVREYGQTFNFPTSQLTNPAFMIPAMFDRYPDLNLLHLASETVETDLAARLEQDLADFHAFFSAPAGSWRQNKIECTLTLGHALGVGKLLIHGDEQQRTLYLDVDGTVTPVASLSLQDGRLIGAALLQSGNDNFVALAHSAWEIQQRWIGYYNRRIPIDCQQEMLALDQSLSRLALFLGLAGVDPDEMARLLGMLWDSEQVNAYLVAQAMQERGAQVELSPPFGMLASYSTRVAADAQKLVGQLVEAAAARPRPASDELPSLRDRLLLDLDQLMTQSASVRVQLAGVDLSAGWNPDVADDGITILSATELAGQGRTFPLARDIGLPPRGVLTLTGSGAFALTLTDDQGQQLQLPVDLDRENPTRIEAVAPQLDGSLSSLTFQAATPPLDVVLEGVWLKG